MDKEYYKLKFIKKSNITHNYKYNYDNINYINSINKVEVICKEHGSFWVRPDAHVRKVGCPKCNGGVRYDLEKFINKANIVHSYKYIYSSVEYINSDKKVKILCNDHGFFYMKPKNHLIGQKCPSCSRVKKKTKFDFIKISNEVHNFMYDYSKIEYKNNNTKVEILCYKHGAFHQTPKDHLKGHGCKFCNISKGENLIENILKKLRIKYIREHTFETCTNSDGYKLPFDFYLPDFNILIEYDGIQHYKPVDIFGGIDYLNKLVINDKRKDKWSNENNIDIIRIKFNRIDEGLNKLYNFLSKNKSVYIDDFFQSSKFDINKYIKRYDEFISYIKNLCLDDEYILNFNKNDVTIDIYLPKLKLGFNLIGLFRDSEFFNKKNCINCLNNIGDIKIIQIFEDTWDNKKEIVKSRIKSLFGKNEKINARSCKIKIINDNKLVRNFLNNSHLQGFVGSKIKIGLFYNDELVSLMIFGNLRKSLGQNSKFGHYEMLRFCNKLNTNVLGAASRIYNFFIKNENPRYIVSYADRCWSNELNMYERIGMKMEHISKPSYYYIIGNNKVGRFSYRKDKLVKYTDDLKKSEYNICLDSGIYRIYDCGVIKYTYMN